MIEYARYLFVDGFRNDQDYYQLLKKNIDPVEWNSYVEGLVDEIRRRYRWDNISVLGKIYITEKWWDRLLDLVRGAKHLPYIQHYEKYLAADYSEELAELYEKGIIDYLKVNTGRKHYQEACRYLERMLKMGVVPESGILLLNYAENTRKEGHCWMSLTSFERIQRSASRVACVNSTCHHPAEILHVHSLYALIR